MRYLFLILLLNFSPLVSANVYTQEQVSNGFLFVSIVNQFPRPISCFISGQYGEYYAFWVYPNNVSRWYRFSGAYRWRCQ